MMLSLSAILLLLLMPQLISESKKTSNHLNQLGEFYSTCSLGKNVVGGTWPNPRKQRDRTFKRPPWDTAVIPGGLQGFFSLTMRLPPLETTINIIFMLLGY